MTVSVEFFAQLRDLAGTSKMQVELGDGTTIQNLLNQIYAVKPQLKNHDATTLIGVGVDFVGRDYVIRTGDDVAIMPPVQGG
jgi:molybdopterin converting factor small subunit